MLVWSRILHLTSTLMSSVYIIVAVHHPHPTSCLTHVHLKANQIKGWWEWGQFGSVQKLTMYPLGPTQTSKYLAITWTTRVQPSHSPRSHYPTTRYTCKWIYFEIMLLQWLNTKLLCKAKSNPPHSLKSQTTIPSPLLNNREMLIIVILLLKVPVKRLPN